MMRSGILRDRVTVKRPSTSRDNRGQTTGSATTVLANVPCMVDTLSGLELIRARKTFADATHRVFMHDYPDTPFTVRDYLVYGSRTLNIGHIDTSEGRGTEYILLVKEDV